MQGGNGVTRRTTIVATKCVAANSDLMAHTQLIQSPMAAITKRALSGTTVYLTANTGMELSVGR